MLSFPFLDNGLRHITVKVLSTISFLPCLSPKFQLSIKVTIVSIHSPIISLDVLGLDSCETAKFSVTQNCTYSTNFSDIEGCLKNEISNSTIKSYDCQPDDFLYNMQAIGQPSDKKNMLFRSVSSFSLIRTNNFDRENRGKRLSQTSTPSARDSGSAL